MIRLKIDNKEYSCIEKWSEMSVKKAAKIHSLKSGMSETLKEYYSILGAEVNEEVKLINWYNGLTDEVILSEVTPFYVLCLLELTDIPESVLVKMDHGYLMTFYKKYCEKFIYSIIYTPVDVKIEVKDYFEFKGDKYYFPTKKNILGTVKPFYDRTALEFTEIADLQSYSNNLPGGMFETAPLMTAIMCRKKSDIIEPYIEEVSMSRAEMFKELNMDIVWQVFFCLARCTNLFDRHILHYMKALMLKPEQRLIQAV